MGRPEAQRFGVDYVMGEVHKCSSGCPAHSGGLETGVIDSDHPDEWVPEDERASDWRDEDDMCEHTRAKPDDYQCPNCGAELSDLDSDVPGVLYGSEFGGGAAGAGRERDG